MLAIIIPLTLLLLIIYGIWIWKKCPYSIPFILLFFIEIAWGTLSIVWIDQGAYISEQLRTSYFTGASIRYILLMLPFALIFPWKTHKYIMRNLERVNPKKLAFVIKDVAVNDLIWYFCVFVVCYLYIDIAISGIPLFSTIISKSSFYSQYSKLPYTGVLHSYILPFAMIIFGIKFGKSIKNKASLRKPLILAASVLIYQLLLENKFYGLYDFAIFFIIPVLTLNYKIFVKKRKIPIKAIGVSLICVGVILFICYNQYSQTRVNAFQYLLDRLFVLQSHTFWGVDLLVQGGKSGFNLQKLINELSGGIAGVDIRNSNYGIAKIMYDVTASTYADDMIKTGFLFAGSFITVSLSYSGYILTFLLSFFIAEITARASATLMMFCDYPNYMILFLAFWVYRRYFEYFRVGTLSMILSWKMLIVYGLLLWLCIAIYRKRSVVLIESVM